MEARTGDVPGAPEEVLRGAPATWPSDQHGVAHLGLLDEVRRGRQPAGHEQQRPGRPVVQRGRRRGRLKQTLKNLG